MAKDRSILPHYVKHLSEMHLTHGMHTPKKIINSVLYIIFIYEPDCNKKASDNEPRSIFHDSVA